jgi:hypothetical protein
MVIVVNNAGHNYNLTTWHSAANLHMLSPVQVRATILDPCLHDGPITLRTANFNLNNVQVDDTSIIKIIQAKILKLGFRHICASVFQQMCPGYSDQPHAAIKHIRQLVPGPDGQLVTVTTIKYNQQMLNAAQPFATQKTYPISVCDKFIQGLDHHILGPFCWFYPQHLTVHDLNDAYQCSQLAIILAAIQAAEDEVKQMQDITRGMMGQGFYTNVIGGGKVPAFPSQAEMTLFRYQGGGCCRERDRKPHKCLSLKCFGCGGGHPWMRDKKIVCPNGKDLACIKRTEAEFKAFCKHIVEMCSKPGGEH